MKSGARVAAGCVICGRRPIQRNHIGGQNHVAWFTMPFCTEHHDQFHELLRVSGVDLRRTDDPLERTVRALKAIKLGEWMLLDKLHEDVRNRNQEKTNAKSSQTKSTSDCGQ